MANEAPKRPWEQRLHEAAVTVEDELRRVITYLNDEVVPEVRQNGSDALRAAAAEMERLAQRMDDRAKRTTGTPPPPPPAGGSTRS
jgi:hypothetical protein